MSDKNLNLSELDELKQAYHLIDEKLDDKEIVTPEQIRTVTLNNISFLKRAFKKDLSWSYLAFVPLLIIWFIINGSLTVAAMWTLGIYFVVELTLRFLLIRLTNRVDHSTLDLKTLLEEENRYRKADIAIACLGFIFFTVFNFVFLNTAVAVTFIALMSLMILGKTNFFRKGISLRRWRETEITEPGKFRRVMSWIWTTILSLSVLILITGWSYNAINGQIDLMELFSRAGFVMICIAVILQRGFRKKIRTGESDIAYKAVMIVAIIAIVLSSVPLAKIIITKTAVRYFDFFPIVFGVLILHINSSLREK